MGLHSLLSVSFVISCFLVKSVLSADSRYENCKPKTCGKGPEISYPFYIRDNGTDYCGHLGFSVGCKEGWPVYQSWFAEYIIEDIDYGFQSFRLVDADVINSTCPAPSHNFSFGRSSINFVPNHAYFYFFYDCSDSFSANYTYSELECNSSAMNKTFVALVPRNQGVNWSRSACETVVAAPVQLEVWEVNQTIKNLDYMKFLKSGFTLKWIGLGYDCANCRNSGGFCGFIDEGNVCYCPDGLHSKHCHNGGNKLALELGLGLGIGFLCVMILLLYLFHSRYGRRHASSNMTTTNSSSEPFSKSELDGGSFFFGVPVYSYKELEEATTNFDGDKELGDGGFGTVYYGKLRDGREVAVKRLYEHNYRRLEQFMNEIAILTRLRHKNLVSLYGCTSRLSRELLLVYEYIPNGTVADHLHGDRANFNLLTWSVRMRIAIETASALAYLHASDVVHRDVKTNNILVDENFSVKVADFGLSRLFPSDVSHVSTAPQGTPGYVDPEYHQCYQLTGKSDVYSFGVVLIELISSKPAVDITRDRSEINLANLAVNKIKQCALDELVDVHLGYKSDPEVKRMTTSVAELAFRCLQQDKEMRPSMEEVLVELNTIEMGEQTKNQEEINDDTMKPKAAKTPSSPLYCDEAALLKNIPLPPSPDSVTNKWMSSSSTTPSVSI